MSSKKHSRKAARRAKKGAGRAWDAMEQGETQLAIKIMRRAVGERPANPVLWNDLGVMLMVAGQLDDAERAMRNALVVAPDYAEGYASLAGVLARLGRIGQAVRAQGRAAELEPASELYRDQLESYKVLVPVSGEMVNLTGRGEESIDAGREGWKLPRYDEEKIAEGLTAYGLAVLEGLLSPDECAQLVGLFADDTRFEQIVPIEGASGDGGEYRFFRKPLPSLVRSVRAQVYALTVHVVNSWMGQLGREEFPTGHFEFLSKCAAVGQQRTTPILLRYRAPAVNQLHQDVWGRLSYPIQMAVVLSSRRSDAKEGFVGGDFVLADHGVGKRIHKQTVPLDLGDAVLFCTSQRLVGLGGQAALQSVRHGMSELTAGERYVLGCPFHDYKG